MSLEHADQLHALGSSLIAKVVVMREGSSLRTADELNACFISDAAGLLGMTDELDDTTEEDRSELVVEWESKLAQASFTVYWDDGFVIYKDLTDEEAEYLAC